MGRRGGRLCRMYGYFHCKNCDRDWESSQVYCRPRNGWYKAAYGQECQNCYIMRWPYQLEYIVCSICGQTGCGCSGDSRGRRGGRHRPHRSDLCGKCQAGYPCESDCPCE